MGSKSACDCIIYHLRHKVLIGYSSFFSDDEDAASCLQLDLSLATFTACFPHVQCIVGYISCWITNFIVRPYVTSINKIRVLYVFFFENKIRVCNKRSK